jgi:hypothetical protein
MSRIASSLGNTLAVIAILAIAVFFSLELVGKPSDPLPNPPELGMAGNRYVPYGGTGMDFTDPVIKGMSVFHCHLLNHADKGMMAKVLFA